MPKHHPGLFASLLITVVGCGMVPRPSGSVGPEDQVPLFSDTRLNGQWRVSITDPTEDLLLAFLAGSCVTIEELSASSWQLECATEALLLSFPASASSASVAELEVLVLLEGVRWRVRMVLQVRNEDLAVGSVEVSVPGSGAGASTSLTLQRV